MHGKMRASYFHGFCYRSRWAEQNPGHFAGIMSDDVTWSRKSAEPIEQQHT